jgi:hypothetical protein
MKRFMHPPRKPFRIPLGGALIYFGAGMVLDKLQLFKTQEMDGGELSRPREAD